METYEHYKIIQHGTHWILEGNLLFCPECRSEAINVPEIIRAANNVYIAYFRCADCRCEFTATRREV